MQSESWSGRTQPASRGPPGTQRSRRRQSLEARLRPHHLQMGRRGSAPSGGRALPGDSCAAIQEVEEGLRQGRGQGRHWFLHRQEALGPSGAEAPSSGAAGAGGLCAADGLWGRQGRSAASTRSLGAAVVPRSHCSPAQLLCMSTFTGSATHQSAQPGRGAPADVNDSVSLVLYGGPESWPALGPPKQRPGNGPQPWAPGPPDPSGALATLTCAGRAPTWRRPQGTLLPGPTAHFRGRQGSGPLLFQKLVIVTEGPQDSLKMKGERRRTGGLVALAAHVARGPRTASPDGTPERTPAQAGPRRPVCRGSVGAR